MDDRCDLAAVLELMEQKRQLLRSVEDVTQEMIGCAFEQLETLMIKRDRLVERIKTADQDIRGLCDERPDGKAVLDAAACRGDAEKLTGTLAEVYRAAQQHRAILRRLRESETQAILRMKQEQLDILEKIKSTSKSGAAKATRFFSVGSSQGGFTRLGNA